jgi:ribonuclease BN (tRNA processing enzyme)
MDVTIVGRSPAVQNPDSACSSYLISEGATRILVDCGHGSVGVLRSVVELSDLSGIVISHMHPDHIFDLVPLTYAFKFGQLPEIPLVLPSQGYPVLEALQEAVGLSETFFAESFEVRAYEPGESLELAGVPIQTALTRHYIQAGALRFVSPETGRSIAYSADTGWSEAVVDLLRGAAIAIVEASLPVYHTENERNGHLTPELAGRMGREAGVDRLVVTHYADRFRESAQRESGEAFGRRVELAVERARYNAEPGADGR